MVSSHSYRQVSSFTLGVVVALTAGSYYFDHVRDSAAALSLMLKEASVIEEVVYKGNAYKVTLGEVEPRPGSILTERAVLSLAYAKRVLRISPPFALPGVQIEELSNNIEKLSQVESSFVEVGESFLNGFIASNTAFPDKSLALALASERARREFISSGDGEDLENYIRASFRTAKQYRLESYLYEAAYRYLAPSGVRYATERHVIEKASTLKTIQLLRHNLGRQVESLNKLETCVLGRTSSCDVDLVEYPVIDFSSATKEFTVPTSIRTFYQNVYSESSENKAELSPAVYLSDGYCQNPEVAPVVQVAEESAVTRIIEAGDVRFLRPSEHLELPFFRHFLALNLPYIPSNPFTHYTCMVVPHDQSQTFAIINVKNYAQSQNMSTVLTDKEQIEIIKNFESTAADTLLFENDARVYLNKVLAGLLSGDVPKVFETPILDLALLFKYKTAGMEHFVGQVAVSEENNVKNLTEGNDIAVTLNRSLFARSPFVALSLFIVHDVKPNELYESFSLPKLETPYYYLLDMVPEEMSLKEAIDFYERYYSSY